MANDFFTRTFDVLPGTRIGSQAVEDQFELVEAGFDKLPSGQAVHGGQGNFAVAGGATDVYTLTLNALVTALSNGLTVTVNFPTALANLTTTPTINVNSLGAKSIVRQNGSAVAIGDLIGTVILSYNTTAGKFLQVSGAGLASETAAATSATNAATSATNAATSATNASTSATNAAASYDSFDDRYLGPKASDPTLDNDGNALLTGAIYWNTTSGVMKAYTGSAWVVPDTGTYLLLTGGTMAGALELKTGANIASAATVNLDTATGNRVHITGTTTITAVTLTRGPRTVIFDGALTLTHHATNNNLPGSANITTATGDIAIYESDGTTVYCAAYTRKDGTAVVGTVGDHAIKVTTGNGHGAVNTRIRRFTTTESSVGTHITYADSANDGASFTIAAGGAGLYEIAYWDNRGAATEKIGISLNSSQLGSGIDVITAANRLVITTAATDLSVAVTITTRLAAADVIRPHTSGTADGTTAAETGFVIRKIGL